MTGLRIWQVAFIEHRLQTLHRPAKHIAVRDAYTYGFEVDDIVAVTGLPVEEVRRIILGRPGANKED